MSRIVWIFPPKPVNPAEPWEWPMAIYNGPALKKAAMIVCSKPYNEINARFGGEIAISVIIFRYNLGEARDPQGKGKRLICNLSFNTLRSCMEFVEQFLSQNQDWQPKII